MSAPQLHQVRMRLARGFESGSLVATSDQLLTEGYLVDAFVADMADLVLVDPDAFGVSVNWAPWRGLGDLSELPPDHDWLPGSQNSGPLEYRLLESAGRLFQIEPGDRDGVLLDLAYVLAQHPDLVQVRRPDSAIWLPLSAWRAAEIAATGGDGNA